MQEGAVSEVSHPPVLRLVPYAAVFAALLCGGITAAGLADLATGWMGQELVGPARGAWVVMVAVLGPALTLGSAAGVRSSWPLQYRYRFDGETLEARCPVLGRRYRATLAEVRRVRAYFVWGPRVDSPGTRGHALETGGAESEAVHLTEALPVWQEVLARCRHAEVDPTPRAWWLPEV